MEFPLTSSHIESVRATRAQSELSSSSLTKSHRNLSSDELRTGADILPLPLLKDVSESPLLNNKTLVEESDEDNDELDLIGSTAFSTEGERRQDYIAIEQDTHSPQVSRYSVPADIAQEAVIEDISMDDQELAPESTSAEIEPEEDVKSLVNGLNDDDNMQADPYGESSSTHSPKHDSMDVYQDDRDGILQKPATIDVPEITGASNIPLPQLDEMPNQRNGLGDFVAIVNPLPNEESSPSLLTPRNLPIKIDLPPIIREDIVIPVPLNPSANQVYHIDTLAAPKSLEPSISPVHYRQQYDPQYKIPSLSILPAEFSRKTRTTKRKKERERDKSDGKRDRDDVLPMGVSRWGATVLANPVWKRVSRATKCLSTREWGVCLHSCRNPASTTNTLSRLP